MIAVVRCENVRESKLGPIKLKRARFPIICADDDRVHLFPRRERMEYIRDIARKFVPSKPVRQPLRERFASFPLLHIQRKPEARDK